MDNDNKELEEELKNQISEWVESHWWDNNDVISGAMATTNCIFGETYVENVELEILRDDTYEFTCTFYLTGKQRDEDCPFYGDTINAEVTGVIFYDEEIEKWEINDIDVSASVSASFIDKDYITDESKNIKEQPFNDIKNLFEYLLINQDDPCFHGDVWFRGQSNKDWKLKTSIARLNNPTLHIEKKLRLEFEKQTTFLNPSLYPLEISKCLFEMQHHGMPTRLLDWTTSPLVALYFAVCDKKYDAFDGIIYVLRPRELNLTYIETRELLENNDENRKFYETVSNETVAIQAPYSNLRMKMQHATFTLHTNYNSLDEEKEAYSFIKEKIIIDKKIKNEVRKSLNNIGYNRATLFPDLDNIAKKITEDIEEMLNKREALIKILMNKK